MKKFISGLAVLMLALPAGADEAKKAEQKTFRVPYRLTNTNHVLLRVKINGKGPYNFIVDTVLARYRLEFDFTSHKMGWTPLDFKPPQPVGLGGQVAPGGLDAIGGIMKFAGALLGKRPEQDIVLRGFLGIGMEEKGAY